MSPLDYLFQPVQIGTMKAKNRILMPGMGTNMGVDEEGYITSQLREYFAARARGGAGMILVGGGGVHPQGRVEPHLTPLWDDRYIPSLRSLAEVVHMFPDVKFGMQLLHGGRQANVEHKVAPSPLESLAVVKGIPKELTVEEIKELAWDAFGESARRCKEAGFDFVEVHAAHGYLINQFLSPIANKRTDEYGGNFENRVRFLRECLDAIKTRAGNGFPVGVRISGDDYIKDGFTLAEAKMLAALLENEGADYLSVSFGIYGSFPITVPSLYEEQGRFVYLAAEIRKVVSIPVVAVGRIKSPLMANEIVKKGQADIVAMGRALIADPDLPNKARNGDLREIRPCIGCCLGCIEMVMKKITGVTCLMNPEAGREWAIKEEKSEKPKRVLVIGAGPAGLEAARVAAQRGHKVIVYEKEGKIGGQFALAAIPPKRQEFRDAIDYYEGQLNNLGVKIQLNTEVNEEVIALDKPEVVIVATGGVPRIPQIPGLFEAGIEVVQATDILSKKALAGDDVLIIGGQRLGLLTADYLAAQGKKVVVIENTDHFAEDMAANDRVYLRSRLKEGGVKLYKNAGIKEIIADGVVFEIEKKEIHLKGFDTIILAAGMRSDRTVINALKNKGIEFHVVGDVKEPRDALAAIAEANEIARVI